MGSNNIFHKLPLKQRQTAQNSINQDYLVVGPGEA